MNETIIEKKTRRHSKRFLGFMIAAAVVCVGSITAYAVYQYRYGNAFKNRENNNGEMISGDVQELESTTQQFNGVVLENTFTDIDISVDCVVCETGVDHILMTASRKDGKPFAKSDEVVFRNGFGMSIPLSYSDYFKDKDLTDASELYWDTEYAFCELNDDGTLSIRMDNTWKANDEEYDIVFGFKDLYSFNYSEKTEEEKEEFVDAEVDFMDTANNLGMNYRREGQTITQSDIDGYNKEIDAWKQIYSSFADNCYEGTFVVKCHVVPNELIIKPEENENNMEIQISGLNCFIRGEGNRFCELAEVNPKSPDNYVDITLVLENGEEYTEEALCQLTDNTDLLEDNPDMFPLEAYLSFGFSKYTDPYKITEIKVNGNTLWKK